MAGSPHVKNHISIAFIRTIHYWNIAYSDGCYRENVEVKIGTTLLLHLPHSGSAESLIMTRVEFLDMIMGIFPLPYSNLTKKCSFGSSSQIRSSAITAPM